MRLRRGGRAIWKERRGWKEKEEYFYSSVLLFLPRVGLDGYGEDHMEFRVEACW